jgi:hypothetical protein
MVYVFLPYAVWSANILRKQGLEGTRQEIELRQQLSVAGLALILALLIYPLPAMVRTLLGYEPAMGPVAIGASEHSLIGVLRRSGFVTMALSVATALLVPASRKANPWFFLALFLLIMGTGIVPDPLRGLALALGLPFQIFYEPQILWGSATFACTVYISLTWSDLWVAWLEESKLRWLGAAIAVVSLLLMEFHHRNSCSEPP